MSQPDLFQPHPSYQNKAIEFFIAGIPVPGGSKRGFALKKGGAYTGRVIITDDAGQRNKDWKNNCGWCGKEAMLTEKVPLFRCELEVEFHFTFPRLKGHFNSVGVIRPSAPIYHAVRPDLSKVIRSTEDGLTGIVWADDAQIVIQKASKRYGDRPGCLITVRPLEEI